MNTTIERVKDLEALSQFLSDQNSKKESHIGFCGTQIEEIYQTLKEDFVDENGDINFLIARNSFGFIVAAIGLDIEENGAEVWGPFNQTSSIEIQQDLWSGVRSAFPTIQVFSFFINEENRQQQAFMKEIMAEKKGVHLTLECKEQNFDRVIEAKSRSYSENDYQSFADLHNKLFPNTYYDALKITERLNKNNILKVLKNESNELEGYAYFEVDTIIAHASLDYIGISPNAQNKGLGSLLLKEVVTEIFSFPQISKISLTVDESNSRANQIYRKVGFEVKDRMLHYFLTYS